MSAPARVRVRPRVTPTAFDRIRLLHTSRHIAPEYLHHAPYAHGALIAWTITEVEMLCSKRGQPVPGHLVTQAYDTTAQSTC